MDARYEKAELLLGKPDEEDDMGHWSKSYLIYFNRVIDYDGAKKHLILFIRKKDTKKSSQSWIIYAELKIIAISVPTHLIILLLSIEPIPVIRATSLEVTVRHYHSK